MNRIVRDNYPSEQLPDDLRSLVGSSTTVRIVIEPSTPKAEDGPLTRYAGAFAHRNVSSHEAVARIRSLRDEWDD